MLTQIHELFRYYLEIWVQVEKIWRSGGDDDILSENVDLRISVKVSFSYSFLLEQTDLINFYNQPLFWHSKTKNKSSWILYLKRSKAKWLCCLTSCFFTSNVCFIFLLICKHFISFLFHLKYFIQSNYRGLQRFDLRTLEGKTWLNDMVINTYMALILDRSQKQADEFPHVWFVILSICTNINMTN